MSSGRLGDKEHFGRLKNRFSLTLIIFLFFLGELLLHLAQRKIHFLRQIKCGILAVWIKVRERLVWPRSFIVIIQELFSFEKKREENNLLTASFHRSTFFLHFLFDYLHFLVIWKFVYESWIKYTYKQETSGWRII